MTQEHHELQERLKDERSQKEQFKNTKNEIEDERRLLDRTVEKLQREVRIMGFLSCKDLNKLIGKLLSKGAFDFTEEHNLSWLTSVICVTESWAEADICLKNWQVFFLCPTGFSISLSVCIDVWYSGGVSELNSGAAGADRHVQGQEPEGNDGVAETAERGRTGTGEVTSYCQDPSGGGGWRRAVISTRFYKNPQPKAKPENKTKHFQIWSELQLLY